MIASQRREKMPRLQIDDVTACEQLTPTARRARRRMELSMSMPYTSLDTHWMAARANVATETCYKSLPQLQRKNLVHCF
jgi:hypothetical protein